MSRPLRITHIQPYTLDLYGHRDEEWGREVRYALPHLAAAQAAAGDRPTVHLLTSGRPSRTVVDGIDLRFHRCVQPPRRLDATRRFARQIGIGPLMALRERPDVIHFHGAMSLQPYLALTAAAARIAGVPLVAQDHGVRPVGRAEGLLEHLGLRGTRRALASNAHHTRLLAERGATGPVRVVPNGVDGVFTPAGPSIRPDAERASVIVVSRMWPDKDPLTMARALARVAGEGRLLHVTLVGTGPQREEVVRILLDAGIAVELCDHIDQPELAARYRGADVLLLTSLREGFNQVTIEAMACGLPVVASDIPGVRDGVGDAGVLVPAGDTAAFAASAGALLDDGARREDLSRRGIARAAGFRWEIIAADVRLAYLEAMGSA